MAQNLKTTKKPVTKGMLQARLAAVVIVIVVAVIYGFPTIYNSSSNWLNRVVGFSVGHVNPDPFRLGLDLRGGAMLTYDVDTKTVGATEQASAVEGARDVIERRVNAFGVGEPLVQSTNSGGRWRVVVELPDIHDVQQAIDMIGATPILEFRDHSGGDVQLSADQKKQMDEENVAARAQAISLVDQIKKGAKFSDLYDQNKGIEIPDVTEATMPKLFAWARRNRVGAVTRELVEEKTGYVLAERGAEAKNPQVTARHILICWEGAQGCTSTLKKEEALQKANELLLKTTPQNFAELAKINSMEPGAGQSGGDLGPAFGKGAMVKGFEDAVFAMKTGEIKGPVETEFGYHIIYKTSEKIITSYTVRAIPTAKKTTEDFFANTSEWKPTGLGGKQLTKAVVEFSPNTGEPQVALEFNSEGKDLFAEITKKNLQKPVAIFLDGQPISTPVVQQPILDGRAVISGRFTVEDAKKLAERLNTGALPLPIKLVSQQTVGASLGAVALKDSARAGIIGFVVVLLFLTLIYRLPGFLASIALLGYIVLVLAVFKFIPVTLTLAGIAGFILSMGMAVDANVLIFERMREEYGAGKNPVAALEDAFPRAWASIRDSNMSSLITCAILYWFGSSIVQGFALTLAIGIAASLFTAITVTRLFLRLSAAWFIKHPHLYVSVVKRDS